MTPGYVDSASLHAIILALQKDSPEHWTDWERETTALVTTALWSNPAFRIAPDPSTHHGARGHFRKLLDGLGGTFAGLGQPDPDALAKTKRWARRKLPAIAKICGTYFSDPVFLDWLDRYKKTFWVAHCEMHGGLFTAELLPEVSRVINCSLTDVTHVHRLTNDPELVRRWVAGHWRGEDSALAERAFSAAVVLRGRYHDIAAKRERVQIVHHPMRRPVLLPSGTTILFRLSNTELYLTALILASAISQRATEARIGTWAKGTTGVRDYIANKRIDTAQCVDDDQASETAVDVIRKCGLRFHAKWVEILTNVGLTGLTGAATVAFGLDPWIGLLISGARGAVDTGLGISRWSVQKISTRRSRLRALALAGAGRLRRVVGQ